jgi:hypothetical protein
MKYTIVSKNGLYGITSGECEVVPVIYPLKKDAIEELVYFLIDNHNTSRKYLGEPENSYTMEDISRIENELKNTL